MLNLHKFLKKISLKNRQNKVNKLYQEEGLSDEVLRKQVEINTERNQYDIPDDSEKIYKDFVQ